MMRLRFALAVFVAVVGLSASAEADSVYLGSTDVSDASDEWKCWIRTQASYFLDDQRNEVLISTTVDECTYTGLGFALWNYAENCSGNGPGCVHKNNTWFGFPGCGKKQWSYTFTGLANKYNCWRTYTTISCDGDHAYATSSWVCGSAK